MLRKIWNWIVKPYRKAGKEERDSAAGRRRHDRTRMTASYSSTREV